MVAELAISIEMDGSAVNLYVAVNSDRKRRIRPERLMIHGVLAGSAGWLGVVAYDGNVTYRGWVHQEDLQLDDELDTRFTLMTLQLEELAANWSRFRVPSREEYNTVH